MKTYQIVCPSCRGNGYIPQIQLGIDLSHTSIENIPCPACDGNKVVTVTDYNLEPITITGNKVEEKDNNEIIRDYILSKNSKIDKIIDGYVLRRHDTKGKIVDYEDRYVFITKPNTDSIGFYNIKARLIIYKDKE